MLISVIMPVYNSERYLETALNCIQQQTFGNWELIAVDDGSTDKSPVILDEASSADSRIKVIHQPNAGAGASRNRGMKEVKGDYIVFMDSDDVIIPEYFELLSAHDEDVVFIDVLQLNDKYEEIGNETMSKLSELSKDQIIRAQLTGKIPWGGCRKCVKRELLTKNNIEYSHFVVGEESFYSFKVLRSSSTIGYIKSTVYGYVVHMDSLSHIRIADPYTPIAVFLQNEFVKMGLFDEYANTLNAFFTVAASVSLDRMAQMYSFSTYRKNAIECRKKTIEYINNGFGIDWSNAPAKAVVVWILLRSRCTALVWLMSKIKARMRK